MEQNNFFQIWQDSKSSFTYGEIYHLIILLQKFKPHLRIRSFLFMESSQEHQSQKPNIICLKGYDEEKNEERCVKVYFLERLYDSNLISQIQELIGVSQRLQRCDIITQICDSYFLQLENNYKLFYVVEQEIVHSQLYYYLQDFQLRGDQKYLVGVESQDKAYIEGIVKSVLNYCSNKISILQQDDLTQYLYSFYVISQEDKMKIKLNLLNPQLFSTNNNQLDVSYDVEQPRQLFREKSIGGQNLPLYILFAQQYDQIEGFQKILPKDLIASILEVNPQFICYHDIQILYSIISDSQNTAFQLEEYGQDYFTLKVFKEEKEFIMKAEKFTELEQAQAVYQLYQKFYSLPRQIFVPIVDKQLIQLENNYYILVTEQDIVIQNLLGECYNSNEEEIEKEESFPQFLTLNRFLSEGKSYDWSLKLEIIKIYLITQVIDYLDILYSCGLSIYKIDNYQIFISSSIISSFEDIQIYLKNPLFLVNKFKQQSAYTIERNIKELQDLFPNLLKDLNPIVGYQDSNLLNKLIKKYCKQIVENNNLGLLTELISFPHLKKQIVQLENIFTLYKNVPQTVVQSMDFGLRESQICLNFSWKYSFYEYEICLQQQNVNQLVCTIQELQQFVIMFQKKSINIESLQIQQKPYNFNYQILKENLCSDQEFNKLFPNLKRLKINLEFKEIEQLNKEFQQLLFYNQIEIITINLEQAKNYSLEVEKELEFQDYFNFTQFIFNIFQKNKNFKQIILDNALIDALFCFNKLKFYKKKFENKIKFNKFKNNVLSNNETLIDVNDFLQSQTKYTCNNNNVIEQLTKIFFNQHELNSTQAENVQKFILNMQSLRDNILPSIQIRMQIRNKQKLLIEFEDMNNKQYGVFQQVLKFFQQNDDIRLQYEDILYEKQLNCNLHNQQLASYYDFIHNWITKSYQFESMNQFIGKDVPYCCSHNQENLFQLSMYQGQSQIQSMSLNLQVKDCVREFLRFKSNYLNFNNIEYPRLSNISVNLKNYFQDDSIYFVIQNLVNAFNSNKNLISIKINYDMQQLSMARVTRMIWRIKRLVLFNPQNRGFYDMFLNI